MFWISHSQSHLLPLLICILHFSSISLACIRQAQIETTKDKSKYLIDLFEFTKTGHLQLNVSQISISNPSHHNLSRTGFFMAPAEEDFHRPDQTTNCYLESPFSKVLYTFDKLQGNNSFYLLLPIPTQPTDEFTIIFQNCYFSEVHVSFNIRSATYNLDETTLGRNYLSPCKTGTFMLGFHYLLIFVYLILVSIWIYVILKMRRRVLRIYYFIPLALTLKVVSLLFVIMRIYIMEAGNKSLFAGLVSGFFKELPVFVVVILITSGWTMLKPRLDPIDKFSLTLMTVFQLVLSIWKVVILEDGPCAMFCDLDLWTYQLLGCLMTMLLILDPLRFRIINTLVEGGQVDGKGVANLRKKEKIDSLVWALLLYNKLTFFVVGFLEMCPILLSNPWLAVALGEFSTLALFAFIGYKFLPEVDSHFDRISDVEENYAAETLKSAKLGPPLIDLITKTNILRHCCSNLC